MPDAVEPVGQDMDQEPADEFVGGEAHHLLPVTLLDAVVLPAKRHGPGLGADKAVVRDGDAVGVTAEIGQHRLGAAEGGLGIDHPFGFAERGQPGGKLGSVREPRQIAEEGEIPGAVQGEQPFKEQAPEQARQHPHVQEKARLAVNPAGAVGRQAAAGDDHVNVGMVGQR